MKVVINYQEYADVELERQVLAELEGVEIVESRTREPKEFALLVKDADAALVQYVKVDAGVIAAMERCRVIVRYGIAVDTIDLTAARQKGIKVCNVPYYCLDEVSNHALALMLALHRRLPAADRDLRQGRHALERLRPIPRLKDCALGLVAFGHIARRLAEKARPLFGEILAADPFVSEADLAAAGVKKLELPALFQRSDFISVHAPLTPATRHLVSAELIAAMKPGAILVNTSRGPVVDEAALIAALEGGRIGGAGLDVFETEPLAPASRLCLLDHVIVTGHYAWYSEGAIRELKETAAGEALRVLKGETPRFEVQ